MRSANQSIDLKNVFWPQKSMQTKLSHKSSKIDVQIVFKTLWVFFCDSN